MWVVVVLFFFFVVLNFWLLNFLHFRLQTNVESKNDGNGNSETSILDLNVCDYLEITPEEGLMIVMPSWLHHAVIPLSIKKKYRTKEEGMRISLAFNFIEK